MVAATDPNIELIAQTGKNPDAIRSNLRHIKLPPGFQIELYAVVPNARHVALAPSSNVLFVGTPKNRVWVVTNSNNSESAKKVIAFAPSINFDNPNGAYSGRPVDVVVAKDGSLLISDDFAGAIFRVTYSGS